jgi:hypothetical protein
VLITNSAPAHGTTIANLDVGLTVRSPLNGIADVRDSRRYTIRRVLSPSDESIDLDQDQRAAALEELKKELLEKATPEKPYKEPDTPRGQSLRRQRSPQQALLLLYVLDNIDGNGDQIANEPIVGFAASFSFSTSKLTASYRVNETWFKQMLDEMADDDDDD